MTALGLGLGLSYPSGRGDPTPGGPASVLLLVNGTSGLLLVDGSSFLKLALSI